jgi:hypothetical protein
MRTFYIYLKESTQEDFIHITATGSINPPKGYNFLGTIESTSIKKVLKDFMPPGWIPPKPSVYCKLDAIQSNF